MPDCCAARLRIARNANRMGQSVFDAALAPENNPRPPESGAQRGARPESGRRTPETLFKAFPDRLYLIRSGRFFRCHTRSGSPRFRHPARSDRIRRAVRPASTGFSFFCRVRLSMTALPCTTAARCQILPPKAAAFLCNQHLLWRCPC